MRPLPSAKETWTQLQNLLNKLPLPKTNMKKILLTIGATLTVIALAIGALAVFNGGIDPAAAYAQQMETARKAREAARLTACSFIGDLTQDCYDQDAGACSKLEAEEETYHEEFEAEAYLDCKPQMKIPPAGTVLESGEIVEDETGIPTDPLFYDDGN